MIISDDIYEDLHTWVKEYINEECIYRVHPDQPPLKGKAPGTFYRWQFYLRRGLFNHTFLSAISQMFLYQAEKELGSFDFQICGMETASTPMLAGIPLIAKGYGLDINAFSVRKNKKEYGLENWIEGRVNNKPILMIDDLCNSTESLAKTLDVLIQEGLTSVINRAFAIVNKTNRDKKEFNYDHQLTKQISMMYLFSLDDFELQLSPNPSNIIFHMSTESLKKSELT